MRLRGALLGLALALGGPLPALALSCLPPHPLVAWHDLRSAEAEFSVVLGALEFDATRWPQPDTSGDPAMRHTPVPARLSGHALTPGGFTSPFDAAVTLVVHCTGPWCGAPPADSPIMAFVSAPQGMVTVDLCNTHLLTAPSPDMIEAMTHCATTVSVGGTCARPELRP